MNTITQPPEPKSWIKIGSNISIRSDKHWSLWHRIFWKILLGIDIENTKEN